MNGERTLLIVLRKKRVKKRSHNNHDHLKFKHGTQRDAQAGVYPTHSERLNVYYNENLKGWFVGRGWKRVWYSSVGIVFFCPRANNLPGFFLLVIGFGGSHEQIRGQKKQATGNSPGQKKTFWNKQPHIIYFGAYNNWDFFWDRVVGTLRELCTNFVRFWRRNCWF